MRIHTRTPRNTTLHHPSMHSDTDTDQQHHKSLHFRTHLDQSRKCLYLLTRVSGCAHLNLLLVNKGTGRGSSLSSLDLETLESADQHDCRGAQDAPLAGERWSSVRLSSWVTSENSSRISVKMVSNRFTLSRTFSRFAEEMLARLALGSGRHLLQRRENLQN